jgi:hypothetical protein
MSHDYDVSLVCREAVSHETSERQRVDVENWLRMPSALANAKLHAQRELEARVGACNRLVWGYGAVAPRAPSAEEAAALMQWLGVEKREKLLGEARLANEQRNLLALIKEAERRYAEQARANEAEQARREAWRRVLEEFEAHDAAGRQARFEAWLTERERAG